MSTSATPHRLLLATDLSARCDRALDRAAQLAEEWQAELIALHVLDAAAAPDQILAWATNTDEETLQRIARQELARDLARLNPRMATRASVRTRHRDDTASAIRDTAARTECDLVITGVARNEAVGRFLLGSTVARLARTLPQPLLVVRSRVHEPYRQIVVATDLSDSSRHALRMALRFFPDHELILYHAYETPLGGLGGKRPEAGADRGMEQAKCQEFLAAGKLPATAAIRIVTENGDVETSLTRYVRQHDIDLVVMGSHGRGGITGILLGSKVANLLDWLPCDALVVREPRADNTA